MTGLAAEAQATKARAAPALGLRSLGLAVLAADLAVSGWVFVRAMVLTPFSDEFDWIFRWYQYRGDHRWAAYLLAPHNLNRLVWTRMLLDLDMSMLGGTNLPLVVSGAAALLVTAALLAFQAYRGTPEPVRLPAAALAVMITLMAGNVMDASLPINVTYTHCVVFAVLALILSETSPQNLFGWRGGAALGCAMASAFGSGAGLALWPVLAWGALRRRDWRWLATVLVVGATFAGLYVSGQGGHLDQDAMPALGHPQRALAFALSYVSLPWSRLALHAAWAAGAVFALLALGLALAVGRDAAPAERFAAAGILFGLATAALAAMGRSGLEDAARLPVRYGLLLAPLHVGFLILALRRSERFWRARPRFAEGSALALMLVLLVQDAGMGVMGVRTSDGIRRMIVAYEAGDRTPTVVLIVHPVPAFAQAVTAMLRRDGLFAHSLLLKPAGPAR